MNNIIHYTNKDTNWPIIRWIIYTNMDNYSIIEDTSDEIILGDVRGFTADTMLELWKTSGTMYWDILYTIINAINMLPKIRCQIELCDVVVYSRGGDGKFMAIINRPHTILRSNKYSIDDNIRIVIAQAIKAFIVAKYNIDVYELPINQYNRYGIPSAIIKYM